MTQEGLNKGILITWTKSFACPDGVGEDAVKMLEEAIARRGVSLISNFTKELHPLKLHLVYLFAV